MFIADAVQEFLNDHKTRGSRPRTVEWYSETLTLALRPIFSTPTQDISALAISRVMATLMERGISMTTLSGYDRALRAFCNWLQGVGLLERNPHAGRKRTQARWKPKQVLTPDEVQALFTVARKDKRHQYRLQAILSLFVGLGLRASEVARLKLEDVDWNAATLRIDGKTGYAFLPLERTTFKYLRRYITHERKGQSLYLFVHGGKPLCQPSLTRLMSRVGKRAGLTRTLGCHLLRHTFATLYLKNGGDTFTLQRLLRHATPAMTTRYLHYQTDDLRSKLEALSPLRGVGNK